MYKKTIKIFLVYPTTSISLRSLTFWETYIAYQEECGLKML